MSDAQWFYSVRNERKGPVGVSELRTLADAGVVEPTTLVWTDGMSDWEPAHRHVSGLMPPMPGQQAPRPRTAPSPVGGGEYTRDVTMGEALKLFFAQYATFSGRSNRGEFWKWVLANILIGFVLVIVDASIFGTGTTTEVSPLSSLWQLAVLLPSLAIGARRLHDTGRSGWWQLIALTVVGIILLIVWWAEKPNPEPNAYG